MSNIDRVIAIAKGLRFHIPDLATGDFPLRPENPTS